MLAAGSVVAPPLVASAARGSYRQQGRREFRETSAFPAAPAYLPWTLLPGAPESVDIVIRTLPGAQLVPSQCLENPLAECLRRITNTLRRSHE